MGKGRGEEGFAWWPQKRREWGSREREKEEEGEITTLQKGPFGAVQKEEQNCF